MDLTIILIDIHTVQLACYANLGHWWCYYGRSLFAVSPANVWGRWRI